MAYKKIYYGYYEMNAAGVIRRVKPGPGTWPGRRIHPYNPGGSNFYVRLSRKGIHRQYNVDDLMTRYFRR